MKEPKFPKLEGVLASRGISYTYIADAINMDSQAFRRRMNGEVEFNYPEIVSICHFLDCEFSELF